MCHKEKQISLVKVKLSVFLILHHAMKYLGSGGIFPRISNFGIERNEVSASRRSLPATEERAPQWAYPLNKRLGGPHGRCGLNVEEKVWAPEPL